MQYYINLYKHTQIGKHYQLMWTLSIEENTRMDGTKARTHVLSHFHSSAFQNIHCDRFYVLSVLNNHEAYPRKKIEIDLKIRIGKSNSSREKSHLSVLEQLFIRYSVIYSIVFSRILNSQQLFPVAFINYIFNQTQSIRYEFRMYFIIKRMAGLF